jgi:hypothetical protein
MCSPDGGDVRQQRSQTKREQNIIHRDQSVGQTNLKKNIFSFPKKKKINMAGKKEFCITKKFFMILKIGY